MENPVVLRRVLPHASDFAKFWKEEGPFKYALTSSSFPFLLLETEEWLFSDDLKALFKELMQWRKRRMKAVKAPVSEKGINSVRIEPLSQWRIKNFPEEWSGIVCDLFTSVGHLTRKVVNESVTENRNDIEDAWFNALAGEIENMGYVLLTPADSVSSDSAYVDDYLKEWRCDEADAGLL